ETWCYPQISVDKLIGGVNIGHPLLSKSCIKNNFSLKENNTVALITGSNMSGKSTFLRTIGINKLFKLYWRTCMCRKVCMWNNEPIYMHENKR
ncbi:MutS protein, partial [human gut metagenome]